MERIKVDDIKEDVVIRKEMEGEKEERDEEN